MTYDDAVVEHTKKVLMAWQSGDKEKAYKLYIADGMAKGKDMNYDDFVQTITAELNNFNYGNNVTYNESPLKTDMSAFASLADDVNCLLLTVDYNYCNEFASGDRVRAYAHKLYEDTKCLYKDIYKKAYMPKVKIVAEKKQMQIIAQRIFNEIVKIVKEQPVTAKQKLFIADMAVSLNKIITFAKAGL